MKLGQVVQDGAVVADGVDVKWATAPDGAQVRGAVVVGAHSPAAAVKVSDGATIAHCVDAAVAAGPHRS